jgi:phosphohistidine phosphatase SixA
VSGTKFAFEAFSAGIGDPSSLALWRQLWTGTDDRAASGRPSSRSKWPRPAPLPRNGDAQALGDQPTAIESQGAMEGFDMKSHEFGRWRLLTAWLVAFVAIAVTASGALAAELEGKALVEALRGGGYNIYFRHAATNWNQDDRVRTAGDWVSCDPAEMRQLSPEGRAAARRIGDAIRALDIPVAKVLSSEYCRAWETARLMDLGPVTRTRDIMNLRVADYVGGREDAIRRAQRVLAQPPPQGANVVIVGHGNLMRAATGAYAREGGSGVYAPRAGGQGFELVAELSADEWVRIAENIKEDGSASPPSPQR